jgi:4-hydroxythreonine-4-phosphate dehydrogenase
MPPVIGLTLGEPAGIGPEICHKAIQALGGKINIRLIGSTQGVAVGKLTKKSAQRAFDALEESAELLKSGEIQAVVNAPIHKDNLSAIGFKYPGHTEFYAERAGRAWDDVTMMMTSKKLTVSLVTVHCSLKQAIQRLSTDLIVKHGMNTLQMLQKTLKHPPRLAVCGLNPHAGENGMFGDEEKNIIQPAIRILQKSGVGEVSGPYSPDTVFIQAVKGRYDAVLCMTHDHGLIPFKLLAFETGVNVTLGLPFWRTSADHGTALDIAGKSVASAKSLISALRLTHQLVLKCPLQ